MPSSTWSLLPVALLVVVAEAAHHVVTVGKGGLKFDPENLSAVVGDTVEYQFFAKNHSVVESSFKEPCVPLANGGFFSGFTPNPSADIASPTTFTITIKDVSKPIWAYCSQTNGDHCQSGMVHSINAPATGNTLESFKELATKAQKPSTSPPDRSPVGGVRKTRVDVGLNGNLTFTPNNITDALPGTIVEFSFNPKNHSVVQSSFDKPCQPSEQGGFSSGFIPTAVSPSGATFEIVIPDDNKPIWFYCAQTTGDHCQKGMVGSINAPAQGNTLEAFIAKAAATLGTPSTIPPQAPLLGSVFVNGTAIQSFNGAVLPSQSLPADGNVPAPGAEIPTQMTGMAGGGQPTNYNWPKEMSDATTSFLQLLQYIDDILLHVLWKGHAALDSGGSWDGVYPKSIVNTIGSMTAQSLVHRSTATDCLSHYQKTLLQTCSYKTNFANVDDFLHTAEKLLLLAIGVLADVSAKLAAEDPWLIPALVSQVGAKSRMTAVVNMMQNHLAAAAPREVMIPAPLAWSYATTHYVQDCPGGTIDGMPGKTWPTLSIEDKTQTLGGVRTTSVVLKWDGGDKSGSHWAAWIGPWGGLDFTLIGGDGRVDVPASLYGHVWVVVTSKKDVKLGELADVTVAGPEVLWVSQP